MAQILSREEQLWKNMQERCRVGGCTQNTQSTYVGCKVSECFSTLTKFSMWCKAQIGFNCVDSNGIPFHLDKDILIKGNKLYSETTCVFIPVKINTLLGGVKSRRGNCPIGVTLHHDGRFRARCRDENGRITHLGLFDDMPAAFYAYKTAKECVIKRVAEFYKNTVDPRTFYALMQREIEIGD